MYATQPALKPLAHSAPTCRMIAFLTLLLSIGCAQEIERVPEIFRPTNAHEAYRLSLLEANLSNSALGHDWIAASEAALRKPAHITSPFRESGYFDKSVAGAIGYVFPVTGGQRVDAKVVLQSHEPLRVFMDLFRLVDNDPQAPIHIASGTMLIEPPIDMDSIPDVAPESSRRLRFEPVRDGTYILRIQPELLRSAHYTVGLTIDASLSFPVAGHTGRSIWSAFGAERDGGRRSHRGIDIFADRGTPVLAAADGVVSRATTTSVGGNVVWINLDRRRNTRLYYAHLDSHSVESGQRVKVGDQLGTVGNTGNARTTPPHLHFGVYARGAVDPLPFLERMRTEPQSFTVDLNRVGSWSRTTDSDVVVRTGPNSGARVVTTLDRHTPVLVWGASAHWYRVELPNGAHGYIIGATTELATPLRKESVVSISNVLDHPAPQGATIQQLAPGSEFPVLGSWGKFLYVQTPTGLNGWLSFE